MSLETIVDLTIAGAAGIGAIGSWFLLPLLGVSTRHTTGCAVTLALAAVVMAVMAIREA